MNRPQDSDRALGHLCQLARAAFTDELSASEQAGWSRLETKLSGQPRPLRPLAVGLGLAAAAAAVAVLALGWHQTPPSLGFRVVDEAGVAHTAPDLASAGRIEFSDGSQVTLTAEARASVTAIDARGARIRLEHGRLSAHFVHLPKASWSMVAGPYQVIVTGTAFDVSWTQETRALELWIRHGSVLVRGPNAGQGLAVFAGQHLLASAASGQIVLDAIAPAAPALPIAAAAPTPAADLAPAPSPPSEHPPMSPRESSRALRPTPSPPVRAPEASVAWPQSLARGDFQRILDEAASRGFDHVLSGATSADLAALADAARYRRRNDLAQQALLAQRQRYPQTLAGRDAAFFLGTLDESRTGREARTSALEWYGRYLAENPAGSFAGQALGRRLVLFESLHDRTAARDAAASYLAKFPAGPYATKARRIVESSQ
jgi:hypothetical protein